MAANVNHIQQLQTALRLTQELKANTTHLLQKLSDGVRDSKETTSSDKSFVADLHQCALAVNYDFSQLEQISKKLVQVPLSLGNFAELNLDANSDRIVMHSKLQRAYKWMEELHLNAQRSHTILQQSQSMIKRTNLQQVQNFKRLAAKNHVYNPAVPDIIDRILAPFNQKDINIEVVHPLGKSTILKVTLDGVLRAIIIMQGLFIEYVNVKAHHESFENQDGEIDIWSKSKTQVFQKVNDHFNSAMLHFYLPNRPQAALATFLNWVLTYSNLFTAPCHRCHRYLLNNLPPTWRDMRSVQPKPFHDGCRPM